MADCKIPEIPFASGVEQNLQRMLAPIKETLDIWAGRIGDPLCRHVTIEDLLDEAIVVNIGGGGGSGSLFVRRSGDTMTGDLAMVDGVLVDTIQYTTENGFPNRTDTTVSFVDGTRTFTITPVGVSFDFWAGGSRFVKTAAESVVIPDTEGMHFIYYDGTGTLVSTTTFIEDIFADYALVSTLCWDATNNEAILIGDERHGRVMSYETHIHFHEAFGTRFISGLALANFDEDGSGDVDSHAQFSIDNGVIRDEDISHSIIDGSPQDLSLILNAPVYYRTGATGEWRRVAATAFPVDNTSSPNGRLWWNEFTGGAWQLTETTNLNFVNCHIIATNNINAPIISIMGQVEYNTVNSARAGAQTELMNLSLGKLIILTQEWKAVATVIYQTANGYSNTVQARVRTADTATGDIYVDWRRSAIGSGGSGAGDFAPINHTHTESDIIDLQTYQLLSEKSAANGYASLGAASLVPTGELGTGTADNTTFLRGDQTWQISTVGVHATTHVTGGSDIIANAVPAGNAGLMNGTDKTKLDGIEDSADVNNISDVDATDLTDAGESTLHYHDADRARANHTGSQTVSTISDFDTEVANNTDVVLNTAKETNATHTGEVTGSGALSLDPTAISNQNIVTALGSDYVLISDSSDFGNLKRALISDFAGAGGDMQAATYDPTTIASDVFDMDNMVEGATTKILTDTERTGIAANTSARHAESHNIASHSDTTATGAELETLTDNSIANTLHRHSELVASDGSPDPALSVSANGIIDTNGAAIELNSLGSGNRATFIDFHSDDTYGDFGLRVIRNNTGANAVSQIIHRGTGSFQIIAQEAAAILFKTTNTLRLTLDSGGKLSFTLGTGINEFSADGTLAGDSDDAVPTEKAVKAYVDGNAGTPPYVKVSDTKANATAGGEFASGAWRTRVLNTEDSDTDGVCSLASNQITLSAGTYECRITAPALQVNDHKAKLRNVTGSSDILIGTSEFNNAGNSYAQTVSIIVGKFTIAASQALEVQHYCGATSTIRGFGYPCGFGVDEVYTVAEFWKV